MFMDDYSSKRARDGPFVSKKGSSLVLRDTANNRDQNPRFCTRIGCSGNMNSPKGNQASCSEKVKSSRGISLRTSSSGKEIIGSSSRKCSVIHKTRNSLPETSKKSCPRLDTDASETASSVQDKPYVPEPSPPCGKTRRGVRPELDDTESSGVAACSNVAKNLRTRQNCGQKSGLHKQDALSTTKGISGNASKCMRNIRFNSVSDVLPSSSLSSDLNLSRRKDVAKKKICAGETSSSAKGKRTSNPWFGRRSISSGSGVSITDLRQTTNRLQERDNGPTLVRTRRSTSGYTRTRVAGLGSGNNLLSNDSHGLTLQVSEPEVSINLNAPSSAYLFSLETSLSCYGRPHSSSESSPSARPLSPLQDGNCGGILNRESLRRFNIDEIAEVFLSLERIEQDEELTYEQLLVLETNLFLNGLNFYDQHRDLRLDIDNMSYEELLALEERMGTVSTALSEEALTECLKTSIYHPTPAEEATAELSGEKDDVKCSICQEEYKDGDEVGCMQCEHRYHAVCVQQWLKLKNWCPICKASAALSSLVPPAT